MGVGDWSLSQAVQYRESVINCLTIACEIIISLPSCGLDMTERDGYIEIPAYCFARCLEQFCSDVVVNDSMPTKTRAKKG